MKLEPSPDHIAHHARQNGLPLDNAHIAALREGYELLQQLRAQLDRPVALDTDLALVFAPEFDR